MASLSSLNKRVRSQLGDRAQPFRDTFYGTGDMAIFELSANNVRSTGFRAHVLASGSDTDLDPETDYDLDLDNGIITLPEPLADGSVLMVEGSSFGILSDEEVDYFVRTALLQHTNGRTVKTRYRDDHGFIQYDEVDMTMDNLPEIEEPLVAMLATIEALWDLTTDASTDIDVTSPDGTHIPRGQRYAQMREQIDLLTEKYQTLCKQLNVGLGRIEMSTLRRISRTTNRYVPVFKGREYDEHQLPVRLLPPIDGRDQDDSGVPSPAWAGWGGY